MNEPTRDLTTIQRWMQAVITHPLGIAAGIESPQAHQEIAVTPSLVEQVITRSHALDSIERLAVYGNAYYARLMECMREMFPALVQALGEELFDSFSFSYLQQYPSRSYTLERLADHFVQFLEETRPKLEMDSEDTGEQEPAADAQAVTASWPDFIIDLARLEWTIGQAFDGPGVERESPLSVEQLAAIPAERWPDARLEPVVCLRLLSFKYPVNDFYTAFRRGEDAPIPDPRASYAAITRRDYIVRRFELSQPQFDLLFALMQGRSVSEAVAECAESYADDDDLAASLQNWFRIWSANGFFQNVRVDL
jgi:hypothetical protein